MQADIVGTVRIAELAEGFVWSWTEENVESFCGVAGLRIDRREDELVVLRTPLKVDRPTGFIMGGRKFLARRRVPHQSVLQLSITVSDTGDESDPSLYRSLVDSFKELSEAMAAVYAAPIRTSPGELAEVGWVYDDMVMLLSLNDASISFEVANPVYIQWWDEDELNYDETASEEEEQTNTESVAPEVSWTWQRRRDALVEAVTRLPSRIQLVVTTDNGDAVTFTAGERYSGAVEVVSRVVLATDRARGDGDRLPWFVNHGWTLISEGNQKFWEQAIPWPARYAEYETLVDATVLALRGPLGVVDPADVVIEAKSSGVYQ